MEIPKIQSKLEEAIRVIEKDVDTFRPDNHDQIKIALGLLEAKRSEDLTHAIITLQQQIPLSIADLRSTISNNTQQMIKPNNESMEVNKRAIFWNKVLTITLICVTLFVGILQAIVIWKTSEYQRVISNDPGVFQVQRK